MTMHSPLNLHASPAAGFDQPFEMLQACHERVQRMLGLMRRLRLHVQTQGVDERARQAARDVMRYFDQAAPAHHEDEERHVFPRLLAAGECVEAVQRLQREHREMAEAWPQVRGLLQELAQGRDARFTPDEEALMQHYESLYDWHVAAENELVYPAAQTRVDAQALTAMGREMAKRRGLP
jgi:hemerythrin-like domain-containing protein